MAGGGETVSAHACFGGEQRFLKMASAATGGAMKFSVFVPPGASVERPVPGVLYLAGLTCTEETFPAKAGAQRVAAELGLALVSPDTSPRGAGIPGEDADWDFGTGAGFYLDATVAPWAGAYRMETHIDHELLPLLAGQGVDVARLGIMGHSMGGHGALTLALKHPDLFASVSALAPICHPRVCPWGRKAFGGYLGPDEEAWKAHDATDLFRARGKKLTEAAILVDQGLADKFLAEQLYPEALEAACAGVGQVLRMRRHAGYDHGYYCVQTFVEDHLRHHAGVLF